MISVQQTNLPVDAVRECQYDIDLACRLAAKRGIAVPAVQLRVVALDAEGVAPGVPHQVPTPAQQLPVSFAARCDLEAQRQTFQIVAQGDVCWVVGGGTTGAQYGVGEVLRCLLGVIWAGVNEEADTLFGPVRPLPATPQVPVMPLRARDGGPPMDQNIKPFLRWLARNRFNLWRRNSGWFSRQSDVYRRDAIDTCRSRGILLTLGDHAIDYFLPEEMFAKHPEWFGLRDGERTTKGMVHMPDCPHLDAILPIQPCWSNEQMCETLVDRIVAHVAEYPDTAVFGLWPHDGVNNWCQCEKCLRRTPYEHMYHLAMRLAKKLPTHIPIELIAYSNLLNPPWHELPGSDRTFTLLCTYLRHYRHPIWEIFDGPHETGRLYPKPDRINPLDEREYGPLFEDWSEVCRKTGSVVGIFEYGGGFYDETRRIDRTRYLYTPNPRLIGQEIDRYIQRGVKVYYICAAYRGWPDNFQESALGEMLWHGSARLEPFRTEFYAAMFGSAGAAVSGVLADIAEALYGADVPAALLEKLNRLLADQPASPRVRRYQLWAQYIALAKAVRQKEVAGDRQAMIALEEPVIRFFDAHRDELAPYFTINSYRKYATVNQQRARDAVAGVAGTNYVL